MFDAVARMPPPPLQQSREFAAALTVTGQSHTTLSDGTIALRRAGPVPLVLLSRFSSRPESLLAHLEAAGLKHLPIVLNPERPDPGYARLGAVPLLSLTTLAELDLTGDLRRNLHQKWRNRLVQAERVDLRITRQNMPQTADSWLLRADLEQQHRRGYRSWPVDMTLAFARSNPGKAKVFTAFESKDPIAAMLILCHGRSATYHVSHTSPRGRQVSAHNFLMWKAMTWLQRQGYERLDLGPVSTETGAGLTRFKLGTGAALRSLGGTWLWWPVLGKTLRPLAMFDTRLMQSGWTE